MDHYVAGYTHALKVLRDASNQDHLKYLGALQYSFHNTQAMREAEQKWNKDKTNDHPFVQLWIHLMDMKTETKTTGYNYF